MMAIIDTLDDSGRYPGGKSLAGLWQWIVARIPTHALYVEPFAGKAAIARHKPPAMETVLIDKDQRATNWLRRLSLPGSTIVNGDGISWLSKNRRRLGIDAVVYVDPYMRATRTKKRIYRHELSDAGHARLLRVLRGLNCRVMISGYNSPLYRRELVTWHVEARPVITRGRTMRDEFLWCNFDPFQLTSSELAVRYHALGQGFRERERVNRKVMRWRRRFAAMPPAERNALLRALIDEAGRPSTAPAVETSR